MKGKLYNFIIVFVEDGEGNGRELWRIVCIRDHGTEILVGYSENPFSLMSGFKCPEIRDRIWRTTCGARARIMDFVDPLSIQEG